jgi:hypothetical protein
MVEVHILQLMDEIELRYGVNEDRWGVLRGILEKQVEQESRPTPDAADLLDAPACCASFVFDGTHHKDCRFAQPASG